MDDLLAFRQLVSERSGGVSTFLIKEEILRRIDSALRREGVRVLDFGAGKGELLGLIKERYPRARLTGADLMGKPPMFDGQIDWHEGDLNLLQLPHPFDVIICSEVIEYLENPRAIFRTWHQALEPNGILAVTLPNQESIRSYLTLMMSGHYAGFLGDSYPGHITPLLRLDLQRICEETGFELLEMFYVPRGGIPKFPHLTWQGVSKGRLKGRLFCDNFGMIARRLAR